MGTVLDFSLLAAEKRRERDNLVALGEVVIFPGVCTERQELDLSHRLRNSAGREEFHGFGRKQLQRNKF